MSATGQGLVWLRGRTVPPAEATISVSDRGFLLGDGVFETMRAYEGMPYLRRPHLDWLAASAEALGIELPMPLDELEETLQRTVNATGLSELVVRVLLSRGPGAFGLSSTRCGPPELVIMALQLPVLSPELYSRGISAAVVSQRRFATGGIEPLAKTTSYLVNILALREATELGADEAVLLDGGGRVAEGASANLFVRVGGVWCTPPLEAGILNGLTRRTVLRLCRDAGIAAVERPLSTDELHACSAAFFSSSVRELVPIVRLDGKPVGDGRVGKDFEVLLGRYRRAAKEWRP